MKQIFRILLLLLTFSSIAPAQSLRFKHISSEDGLSTNYITAIHQDRKGFMWFGTQEGLNRYNGYGVQVYKSVSNDLKSLSHNDIQCLYEADNGDLYIGTNGGGLNIYHPATEAFERLPTGGVASYVFSDSRITCFYPAQTKGFLWVGTGRGIDLFDRKTKTVIRFYLGNNKDGLKVNAIDASHSQILAATESAGLWELKGRQFQRVTLLEQETGVPYHFKNPENYQNIKCLIRLNNRLYLGTGGGGLVVVDATTYEVLQTVSFDAENNPGLNDIKAMSFVNGQIYLATDGGFISFSPIDNSYEAVIKNDLDKYSLSDNKLTSLFIDHQENIWLGSYSQGINVAFKESSKFPRLPSRLSQAFKNVYSIMEDNEGHIWIGGEKSLKVYNRAKGQVNDLSKVVDYSTVLSIRQGAGSSIWMGTWGNGLLQYNKYTGTLRHYLSNVIGGTIITVNIDKQGTVWAGSYGDGLFAIRPNTGEVTRYTTKDGLSSDNIYYLYFDSKDNLWIGTDGGGVSMKPANANIEPGAIQQFKNQEGKNSLIGNAVTCIYEDPNHKMWFATTNGLSAYSISKNQFYNYSEKDGLANGFLYSILPDRVGNLWMSTNKGLSRLNPKAENVNGSAFKNYDLKDGLLNSEHSQGAFFKSASGELFFGGINGFNAFFPQNIKDNPHAPPVYIVNYQRGGKDILTDTTITLKKNLTLKWTENFFQFEVVALDYLMPSKNHFMYKLEGYDNDWSEPTNVRYVSYTELPGGHYVFKVKAANSDGVWNDIPAEIHIQVIPPWWKTKWFYALSTLLIIGLVVGFIWYRTRSIRIENRVLEQRVAERTHELAQKNRDITSSIEYAKRIQEAILPSKEVIYRKLKNVFILYKPKDIVSGDFYWFGEKNNYKIIAVVDCTGHGVPGAFMSMIGHNLLHQIVSEKGISDPGQILDQLHMGVQEALKQGQNEVDTNDGMDISILSINTDTLEAKWAGAFRSLVIVNNNGELHKLDGNKYPVGGAQMDVNRRFISQTLTLHKHDTLYMFSDGYADQFGGEKGKKFMVKRFHDLLASIHEMSMHQQQLQLEKVFEEWKSGTEQIDDVLVVGIRV